MAVYPKSFTTNNFVQQSDGRYKATILAETHGLGFDYRVTKVMRRDSNYNWHNMVASYAILDNGDFELYLDEPCICKVYLVGDE